MFLFISLFCYIYFMGEKLERWRNGEKMSFLGNLKVETLIENYFNYFFDYIERFVGGVI